MGKKTYKSCLALADWNWRSPGSTGDVISSILVPDCLGHFCHKPVPFSLSRVTCPLWRRGLITAETDSTVSCQINQLCWNVLSCAWRRVEVALLASFAHCQELCLPVISLSPSAGHSASSLLMIMTRIKVFIALQSFPAGGFWVHSHTKIWNIKNS